MTVSLLLRRCLLALVLAVCAGTLPAPVLAADVLASHQQQVRDARSVLQDATKRLADVRRELGDVESSQTFMTLSERALQSQRDADETVRGLTPSLEQVDARLAQLGDASDAASEGRDLTAQRKTLTTERNALDALIKQANLLSVEARQLADSIEKLRVQQFSQQLSQRVESPLSPQLWAKVVAQLPDDLRRSEALLRQGRAAIEKGLDKNGWLAPVTGAVVALVLFLPLRIWLRRLGRRFAASPRAPQGRLRRSGLAVWLLTVGTLLPGLAAMSLMSGLEAIGGIAPRLVTVADAFVTATFLSAFTAALSACLLVPTRSSWRLLPIDDIAATRLRKYAWMAAGLMWVTVILRAFNRAARTGQITGVALDGVLALAYIGLIMAMLVSLARLARRRQTQATEANENAAVADRVPARNGWMVLVSVVGHLTVVVALLAALLGWINLAMYAAWQMIWIGVVVLALTLLLKFADDLASGLFAAGTRTGKAIMLATGLGASRLEQAGVLVSAGLRLGLILLAVVAIALPQGNANMVLGWVETLRNGITIGEVVLRPGAILRSVMVLLAGLAITQLFQRWLVDTYLPRTELDIGGRNSVGTAARYPGLLLVALWTLAALGIGFEKLALVVSALSVGIGFGLQAITQNFVSGLILLAERPVKVGDLVRIGDAEGDIRKISVRATEIQMADKSTLVVPNSELITKTVRNMTMANPLGRVQIKFQVPLSTDILQLRTLLLEVFVSHPGVVESPAPVFLIDNIDDGMIAINSHCHVASPRNVSSIRSDLLLELLQRLQAAGIPLATPTDIHVVNGND